ncbi:MAG: sugar transferase [Candidatus Omnitrophica bacterium]|jgi:lipopolysaccharide/colanic/teichoic acid biosynthesis glycosyltransferase|nr:sugar transferase [Candidatus Omnitrophota bacterium]
MPRNYKLFLIQKELKSLRLAWQSYIVEHWLKFIRNNSGLVVTVVFLTILIGSLLWTLKSFVNPTAAYGQVGILVEDSNFWIILTKALSWFVGGGFLGIIFRLTQRSYARLKRIKDLLIAAFGLMIFSPLFAIIAVLIKLDSPGSVFFRQTRVGHKGKIFGMWKFRTMRSNAEFETGPVWAQDDDPRITKLGQFLRKTHLDELPQLINILCGDMSLIGPRPERPELVAVIKKTIPHFDERLTIRPGIAGLAQSRYQYGASVKDSARKLKYDLIYINRMCLLLDLRILLWTTGKVLTGEGAR